MKTWVWMLLTISTLLVGCAPGYYEKGSASQEQVQAPALTGMTYRNPETTEEQTMRIWRESIGR